MAVEKFVLMNGTFVNVSTDFTPEVNRILSKLGQTLFVQNDGDPTKIVQLAAGYINTEYKVATNQQEFITVTADTVSPWVANMVDGNVYGYNGLQWSVFGTIASMMLRGRFYYSTPTKKLFLVDLAGTMHPVGRIHDDMAPQADVTAGTGTGLVSPATLKVARGFW